MWRKVKQHLKLSIWSPEAAISIFHMSGVTRISSQEGLKRSQSAVLRWSRAKWPQVGHPSVTWINGVQILLFKAARLISQGRRIFWYAGSRWGRRDGNENVAWEAHARWNATYDRLGPIRILRNYTGPPYWGDGRNKGCQFIWNCQSGICRGWKDTCQPSCVKGRALSPRPRRRE